MARTLSDTVVIAMIEAATRLAGGRGPIGGSTQMVPGGTAPGEPTGQLKQAGNPGQDAGATAASGTGFGRGQNDGATQATSGEQDRRTADEIASDFKTIYTQIEEVVRISAEQETKAVGFGVR